jgi:hypothetical protein
MSYLEKPSNSAFERAVDTLASARGRRGGHSASAARCWVHRAAAQRER